VVARQVTFMLSSGDLCVDTNRMHVILASTGFHPLGHSDSVMGLSGLLCSGSICIAPCLKAWINDKG